VEALAARRAEVRRLGRIHPDYIALVGRVKLEHPRTLSRLDRSAFSSNEREGAKVATAEGLHADFASRGAQREFTDLARALGSRSPDHRWRSDAPMCSFVRKLGHAKTQAALMVVNPT
jgi:hypothetical protein